MVMARQSDGGTRVGYGAESRVGKSVMVRG